MSLRVKNVLALPADVHFAASGGVAPVPETVVHFQIRMPPVLHEQLASWAKNEKNSLNALIVTLLVEAAARRDAETTRAAS